MTTIDLNHQHKWKKLFEQVEAGKTLRVVRGKKQVAIIKPADAPDKAFLDQLADMGAKQIADTFPPHEYAKWDKRHGSR